MTTTRQCILMNPIIFIPDSQRTLNIILPMTPRLKKEPASLVPKIAHPRINFRKNILPEKI